MLRNDFSEFIGKKFNNLTVIEIVKTKTGRRQLKCQCTCGNYIQDFPCRVFKVIKCKPCQFRSPSVQYIGQKFGKLKVLDIIYEKDNHRIRNIQKFLCLCDCGKKVTRSKYDVLKKNTQSCGCGRIGSRTPDAAFNTIIRSYKTNAKSVNRIWELSKEEVRSLLTKNCTLCGLPPNTIRKTKYTEFKYNGIDRINNLKGYTKDNVQTLCIQCNNAKYTLNITKFNNYIQRLIEYTRYKKNLPLQEEFNLPYSTTNYFLDRYKRSAKKKGLVWLITRDQFINIITKNCTTCGVFPESILYRGNQMLIHNSIDRIDSTKGYSEDNIQTLCWICNQAKRNQTQKQFKNWIKRLVNFQLKKNSVPTLQSR